MTRRLGAILLASHPGPTVLVSLVSVLLALVSGLDPTRVAGVGIMMAANQLSIGWSNDAIDAARDQEAERSDKPAVRGDVSVRLLFGLAIAAAVVAVAVSIVLGWATALVHAVALGAGWAYNVGLKRTIAASLCYVVGFGAIPLMVTLAGGEPRLAAWWAIAVGGMLGLAGHFANVLPDLDDDIRHGVRALPHRLGARASGAVALTALAAAGFLAALGPGAPSAIALIGAGASLTLLAVGVVVLVRDPRSRALFRVIMLAAVAAVATLAGSADAIAAAPLQTWG